MSSTVQRFNELFTKMHQDGALRPCASTVTVGQAFKVNGGNSAQAIVAGIMTFGGAHAPLVECGRMFNHVMTLKPDQVRAFMKEVLTQGKVPGFGSGFIKDEPDKIHSEIDAFIKEVAAKQHYFMVEMTHHVQELTRKGLYPNTALYSAIYANCLNINPVLLPGMAIEARVPVWNYQLKKQITDHGKK
jgi:citrate synthase